MLAVSATLLAGTAQAVDLRSWDQRINVASNRFIVLASFKNQAVLDKETQLVWQRSPDPTLRQWESADFECARAAIGGRYGWRLPSRSEVMTLLDPAATGSVKLPVGHPFIGIVGGSWYWTGDRAPITDPNYHEYEYKVLVNIGTGFPASNTPATSSNVRSWCVRGPGK
jgi:hypothetical protein